MKAIVLLVGGAIILLACVVAILISAISSILGVFVSDEFDEYHYHPDNEI